MPSIKELFLQGNNNTKFAPSYPTRYWRSLPNPNSPITYRLNTIFDENDMKWSFDSSKTIDFTATSLIYSVGKCGSYVATAMGSEALMAMNGAVTEQIINARRKNVFIHKQNGEFICELSVCEEEEPPVFALGWTVCGKLIAILQNGRLKLFDLRDTKCSFEEITIFSEKATENAKKARDDIIKKEKEEEEKRLQEQMMVNTDYMASNVTNNNKINENSQNNEQNAEANKETKQKEDDKWEIVIKDGVKKKKRRRTYADTVKESIEVNGTDENGKEGNKLKGLLDSMKKKEQEERRKKREELKRKKYLAKKEEENRCILSHVKFFSTCGNAFSCVCRHLESGMIALITAPLGPTGSIERDTITVKLINPSLNPIYNHIFAPTSSKQTKEALAVFSGSNSEAGIVFGSTSVINSTNRSIVDIDVIRANVFPPAGQLNINSGGDNYQVSHTAVAANTIMKDSKRVSQETLNMMKLTNIPITPDTLLSILLLTSDGQIISITQGANDKVPQIRAELFFQPPEQINYPSFEQNINNNIINNDRDIKSTKFSGIMPCCNEAARLCVDDVSRRFLAVYWPVGDSYIMNGGTKLFNDFYSGMKKEYNKQSETPQNEPNSSDTQLTTPTSKPSVTNEDQNIESAQINTNREIVMKMLMKELSIYGLTKNETFALQKIVGVMRVYSFTFTNPFIDFSLPSNQQNQFLSEYFVYNEHDDYPYNYFAPKPTGKNNFLGWVSDVSPCISLVLKERDELTTRINNDLNLDNTTETTLVPLAGSKKNDDIFSNIGTSALSSLYQSTKCTGVMLFGPHGSSTFYHMLYGSEVSLFANEVDGFRIFNKYGSNLLMQVPIATVEMFSPLRVRSVFSHIFEAYSASEVESFVADKLFRQLIDRTASGNSSGLSASSTQTNTLKENTADKKKQIINATKDLTVVSQFDSSSSVNTKKTLAELLMEIIEAVGYESEPSWSKLILACVSYSKMFTNEGRICCSEFGADEYLSNEQLKAYQIESYDNAVQVSSNSENVEEDGLKSGKGGSNITGISKAVPWLSRSYLPYFYASLFGTSLVLTSPLAQIRIYPKGSTKKTHYDAQTNAHAWVLPSTAYISSTELLELPPSNLLTDSYLFALRLQRVCIALRKSGLACMASEIKSEGIIPTLSKLLAINDHATCFIISQLLRISPRTVLLDWATRLIIANPTVTDVEIAFNIFRRFRNFNIGYHEIVPSAIEVQRSTLANLLMHSEVDLQTRMHFYIQIGDFRQAIFTALESNDTELALTTMMVAAESEEGMKQLVQLVTVDPRVMRLFLHKNRVARSGLIYQIAESSKPKNYVLMAESEWRNAHVQKSPKKALVNLESARICGLKAEKRMEEAVGMVKNGIDLEKMSKFFSSLGSKIKKQFVEIKDAFNFKKKDDDEQNVQEGGEKPEDNDEDDEKAARDKKIKEMMDDVNTDEITDDEELAAVRKRREEAKQKAEMLKVAAKKALEASIAANAAAASFGISDAAGTLKLIDISKYEASLLKLQREISAVMHYDLCGLTVFDTLVFVLRKNEENFAKKLREKLKISNKLWMAAHMYVYGTSNKNLDVENVETQPKQNNLDSDPDSTQISHIRYTSGKMIEFMKKMKKDADYVFGYQAARFAGDYTTATAFIKMIPDPKERFRAFLSIGKKEEYVHIGMHELTTDELYEMMSEYNGYESSLRVIRMIISEKERLDS